MVTSNVGHHHLIEVVGCGAGDSCVASNIGCCCHHCCDDDSGGVVVMAVIIDGGGVLVVVASNIGLHCHCDNDGGGGLVVVAVVIDGGDEVGLVFKSPVQSFCLFWRQLQPP